MLLFLQGVDEYLTTGDEVATIVRGLRFTLQVLRVLAQPVEGQRVAFCLPHFQGQVLKKIGVEIEVNWLYSQTFESLKVVRIRIME